MKFDRAQPFRVVKSFSRRRYLQDQAELNRHFWMSRLCADIASMESKRKAVTTTTDLLAALKLTSAAEPRTSDLEYTLQDRLTISGRWLRLTTLLIALSAFERYIASVSSTALQSDPAREDGWPKKLDGLTLKKYELSIPAPPLEGLVKGDWNQRASAYRSTFKHLPSELSGNLAELEKMRKMRNGVAHEFGFDDSVQTVSGSSLFASLRPGQSQLRSYSVSQQVLMDWLAILNKVAKEVDRHLVTQQIGGYELAAGYLSWLRDPDRFESLVGAFITQHRRDPEVRFRHVVGQILEPLSHEYFTSMRNYIALL